MQHDSMGDDARPNPHSVHHSSARQDWATPPDVFEELERRYGPFDLDAAASADNAKCPNYWTENDDALTKPWEGRIFCNPPYNLVGKFVEHGIRELQAGRAQVVVFLVVARPDTVWWREAWERAHDVVIHSGRIRFGDGKGSAPFPSAAMELRRPATWSSNDQLAFTMSTFHGSRPRWYRIKGDPA